MAKAKSGANKAKSEGKKATSPKRGVPSSSTSTKRLAKPTAKSSSGKGGTKASKSGAKPGKATPAKPSKAAPKKPETKSTSSKPQVAKSPPPKPAAAVKPAKGAALKVDAKPAKASVPEATAKNRSGASGKGAAGTGAPSGEKTKPRATKLPPRGEALTTREMEQILTVGAGRGVGGEGSVKGKLVVKDQLPYLQVVGRDKRELVFLLQGPEQEVLPAYVDHKVSVSGLIRKTNNHGGTVDVRKYTAKKPELLAAPVPVENKLRYLSPGEVEQVCNAGMGAGIHGFASLRGNLEMTGDAFFLVVSNAGTRHQVSFLLGGKSQGLQKYLGQTVVVTGVLDKASGWGGRLEVEAFEPRPSDFRSVSREGLDVVSVQGQGTEQQATVKLNHGLSVRLPERAGHTWAIEPTLAKRLGLREANFEPTANGPSTREFFFTPRNPGSFDAEFFLAKAFTPAQVAETFKLQVTVVS